MAKGYTTVANVESHLGRTLTTGQVAEATVLLDSTEAFIDRETRRAWIVPPITGERYDLIESVVYLRFAPVASVEAVTTRTTLVGDSPVTLLAGVDYELVDPVIGEVQFVAGYRGPRTIARISYTPDLPVPADITRAATLIVAQSLMLALFPDRSGVQKVQADRETAITYFADGLALEVPASAQYILDGYRRPIIA